MLLMGTKLYVNIVLTENAIALVNLRGMPLASAKGTVVTSNKLLVDPRGYRILLMGMKLHVNIVAIENAISLRC